MFHTKLKVSDWPWLSGFVDENGKTTSLKTTVWEGPTGLRRNAISDTAKASFRESGPNRSLLLREFFADAGRGKKTQKWICPYPKEFVSSEIQESQDEQEGEALLHVSQVNFGNIVRNACALCHSGEGFCVLARSSKQNAKKDQNRLILIELVVKNTFA